MKKGCHLYVPADILVGISAGIGDNPCFLTFDDSIPKITDFPLYSSAYHFKERMVSNYLFLVCALI